MSSSPLLGTQTGSLDENVDIEQPKNGDKRPSKEAAPHPNEDKEVERITAGEKKNALLVVAVLIASATYETGLSPPGGVWDEDTYSEDGTLIAHAGTSIMGTKDPVQYIFYMFGNSIGFFVSIYIIAIQTHGFPHCWALLFGIVVLGIAYVLSLITIAPTMPIRYFYAPLCSIPALLITDGLIMADRWPYFNLWWQRIKGYFQRHRSSDSKAAGLDKPCMN